jgi:hypothetical protein
MTTSQGSHKATLLSNGKVLIEASYGSGDDIDSPGGNELYDPETGAFQSHGRQGEALVVSRDSEFADQR